LQGENSPRDQRCDCIRYECKELVFEVRGVAAIIVECVERRWGVSVCVMGVPLDGDGGGLSLCFCAFVSCELMSMFGC